MLHNVMLIAGFIVCVYCSNCGTNGLAFCTLIACRMLMKVFVAIVNSYNLIQFPLLSQLHLHQQQQQQQQQLMIPQLHHRLQVYAYVFINKLSVVVWLTYI